MKSIIKICTFYMLIIIAILFTLISCKDTINKPQNETQITPFYTEGIEISYTLLAYQELLEGFALSEDDTLTYSKYLPPRVDITLNNQSDAALFNNNDISHVTSGYYSELIDTICFQINSWNRFHIYGNNNSPTINDSILSPKTFGLLTYPANKQIIRKDSSLTLTWNSDNNDEKVVIEISSPGITNIIHVETADNGSYTVSSNQLSNFPNGVIKIDFKRGSYLTGTASDNKNYFLSVWSEHVLSLFLI